MPQDTHPILTVALGLSIAAALAGCGKSEPAPPQPVVPAKAQAAARPAADQGATAEVVARQARGDLSCPPRTGGAGARRLRAGGRRAGRAPCAQVRRGDEGRAVHQRAAGRDRRARARLQPEGAWRQEIRQGFAARPAEPRVVKTSKQIMKEMQDEMIARSGNAVREDLQPGQVKWFVGSMGLPGEERVLSVAREERFAADQRPTAETVTEALLKKYGMPTQNQRGTSGQLPLLRWAYDPLGRVVSETSPLYHKCQGISDPNGGVNLSPDCGIVVQAMLIPQRDNPALVDRLQVGVVDQAGGYRMLTATEQALGQADQQRRAAETAKAAKSAKAPTL